jgi:adenosylhomocysteine nucleosidase
VVHFGPIAAGEIVQDSTISDQAGWIREHYNDAVAIEMEAAGVAQAGHLNNSLPVIVIRGISDRADGSKTVSDRAHWQPKAVASAAAFAVALAEELVVGWQNDRPARPREAPVAPESTSGVTNIATGNAKVGVQAGQIIGNVSAALEPEAPADLTAHLNELAVLLSRAHHEGRLDQHTYLAAEAELQVAADSLPARTEQSRSRLMLALKKLRRLIADLTDLAAKVATIISAAKGLS